MRRINKLKKATKTKLKTLPKEILNGHEIMKALKLKPGPEIQKIKEKVREQQLKGKIKNKKEALRFVKFSK